MKMSVIFSSNWPANNCLPSPMLMSRAVTLMRSPHLCIWPSNTASTFKARPAARGSCSKPPYLRTAPVGRTTISLLLLSLAISVSAIPNSNTSSRPSRTRGLKGSTASDLTPAAVTGGSGLGEKK